MKNLHFYYCLILTILLTLGAAVNVQTISVIPFILFLPVTIYFLSLTLRKISGHHLLFPLQKLLSSFGLYYGFIVVTIMTISGLVGAKSIPQLISSVIFIPLTGYFVLQVLPKKRRAINIPAIIPEPKKGKQPKKKAINEESGPATKLPRIDVDKRQFLKLIGSAGLSVFLFSIFAKKTEAAFFGSVPGPGTLAIKDSTGTVIDPAQKQPTDGYRINQMDETSDPPNTYFGYINKNGAWFIMRDDGSGNYRYTKGASSFTNATTGWPKRATGDLTYDYFDVIFD